MPKVIVFNFPVERMHDYIDSRKFTEEDAEELSNEAIQAYKELGFNLYYFDREQIKLF